MTDEHWPALVPELSCQNLSESLAFYGEILGFRIKYERLEKGFAYLQRGEAHIMLEQLNANWKTGAMERPFGRGINFQIEVDDVQALRDRVAGTGFALFEELRTAWYRQGDVEHGQREFLVLDPDGYLLRFCQTIGKRPAHA